MHDILNRHTSKIKVSSELAENVDVVSYMQDKTSASYPSYSPSAITRTYAFYQVLMFPYIYEPIFPYDKKVLVPYGSNYSSVPEGDKRMWYNAAKEVLSVIEDRNRPKSH